MKVHRQELSWFLESSNDVMIQHLIVSFKLRLCSIKEFSLFIFSKFIRCLDEIDAGARMYRRDVMPKLLRYLQATRATILPEGRFSRSDVTALKHAAVFQ